jgi:hypothetical protein
MRHNGDSPTRILGMWGSLMVRVRGAAGVCRTPPSIDFEFSDGRRAQSVKVTQGWPKNCANFRQFIGLFSQNIGST